MSTHGFNEKIIKELAIHDPSDASAARAAAS